MTDCEGNGDVPLEDVQNEADKAPESATMDKNIHCPRVLVGTEGANIDTQYILGNEFAEHDASG